MVSTKLIEKLFVSRQKEIDTYTTQAEAIQEKVFRKLTAQASDTEWGKKYDFAHIRSYADFQRVPIQQYDDIKGYVDRMRHGEKKTCFSLGGLSGMPSRRGLQAIKASSFP